MSVSKGKITDNNLSGWTIFLRENIKTAVWDVINYSERPLLPCFEIYT